MDFDTWFDLLKVNLNDRGVSFNDANGVRDDYDRGRDLFDVVDEIAEEYE
jgi:hypothetical protein